MEQDETARSEQRVRMLAEIVGLPVGDSKIPGLALAFDAAMAMIDGLESIARTEAAPAAGPYDAAWSEKGMRR